MASDSPTARAVRTLALLQQQPGITADRIAGTLGVTDRAARRYVEMLREADIPIASIRGRYGGYRIGGGVRLPPVSLSTAEALALVMAVLDGSHAAADEQDLVGAALGKLLRALPRGVGGPAATMRRHAAPVPDRSAARPDIDVATALVDAVADRSRTRIGYRSAAGARWQEDVDPWAVVVRHGLWYLLCHSHWAEAVRTYRIDRISGVTEVPGTFEPPADLDAAATLEQHLGSDREFLTRVFFDAPVEQVRPFLSPVLGTLRPDRDGCVLEGTTSNPTMVAAEWLAAVPVPFRVEGGPELRAAIEVVVDRLSAAVRRQTTY